MRDAWDDRDDYGSLKLYSIVPVILMDLLYQNSGWFTFGYRFSNDYAVLLFLMLAISVRRFGVAFWVAAIWASQGVSVWNRSWRSPT